MQQHAHAHEHEAKQWVIDRAAEISAVRAKSRPLPRLRTDAQRNLLCLMSSIRHSYKKLNEGKYDKAEAKIDEGLTLSSHQKARPPSGGS